MQWRFNQNVFYGILVVDPVSKALADRNATEGYDSQQSTEPPARASRPYITFVRIVIVEISCMKFREFHICKNQKCLFVILRISYL